MYLFFDTETTGLPNNYNAPIEDLNNWPRLVQLAWVIYDENAEQKIGANYIIQPEGFIIPEQASRVHGITTERANEEGRPLIKVLEEFAGVVGDSKLLIAHNMDFDEFQKFYGPGHDPAYVVGKWQDLNRDISRWFCELDLSKAAKFMEGL